MKGEHIECKQSDTILESDSSLPLDQITILIHTDKKFNSVMNVVKLSRVPIIFTGIQEVILERNPMNVIIVVQPLQGMVICKGIKERILERNFMNVIDVVKSLHVTVISNVIKEHILERNPMNCLLYTSPSPRDLSTSRMPSSA